LCLCAFSFSFAFAFSFAFSFAFEDKAVANTFTNLPGAYLLGGKTFDLRLKSKACKTLIKPIYIDAGLCRFC
jgi:hypothetical protein